MKPLVVTADAEDDVVRGFEWYEQQRPGLGGDFLLALRAAVQRLQREPTSFARIHGAVRRVLVARFPYLVLYRDDPNEIVVVAFFHARRDPSDWKRRS